MNRLGLIIGLVVFGIPLRAAESVLTNLYLRNPSPVSNGVKVLIFPLASNGWTYAATRVDRIVGTTTNSDQVFQQISSNRIAVLSDMPALSTQQWQVVIGTTHAFPFTYGHVAIVTNSGNVTNWKKYDVTNGYAGFSVIDPAAVASTNRYPLAGIIAPNGTQTMTNALLFDGENEPMYQTRAGNGIAASNITQRFIDAGPLRVQIETVISYRHRTSDLGDYAAGPAWLTNTITLDAMRRRVRFRDFVNSAITFCLDVSSAVGQFNGLRIRNSDSINNDTAVAKLWNPLWSTAYPLYFRNGTYTDCVWPVNTNTTISPYYAGTSSNGATDIRFQLMPGTGHIGGVGSYDIGYWLLFTDTNAVASTPMFGMIQGDMGDELQSYASGWTPYNSPTNHWNMANGRFGFRCDIIHRPPNEATNADFTHARNWSVFVGTNGMLQWGTNEFFWQLCEEASDELAFSSQDVVNWNLDTTLLSGKQHGYMLMEEGQITNVNFAIQQGNTTLSNELYTYDSGYRDLLVSWGESSGAGVNALIATEIATGSNALWMLMNGDGSAPNFINYLQGSQLMGRQVFVFDQALWNTARSTAKDEQMKFLQMFWSQCLFDRGYYTLDAYLDGSNRRVSLGSENMPGQVGGARDTFSVYFNPLYTNRLNSLATVSNNVVVDLANFTTTSPHYFRTKLPRLYNMLALQQRGIDFTTITAHTNAIREAMRWYMSWIGPLDPRFQNRQARLLAIRDGDHEATTFIGEFASLWRTNDTAFERKAVGAWHRGGKGYDSFYLDSALAARPSATSNAMAIASEHFNGSHSHYRAQNDTTNETAVWLINGTRMRDHAEGATGDGGELSFYALQNLQTAQYGWNSGVNYQIAVWTANTLAREGLVPTWNGTNSASELTEEWGSNTNRNYIQFGKTWWADAELTNTTDCGWTRSVKVFQVDPEWPVIQCIDTFTGSAAISNRVMFRKIAGTGDVVIAGNTFSPKQTSAAASETPSMTNTFNIPTGGVFRIQTTGQVFTAHSGRGTDLDWWLWQPTNSEVTAGTHRQAVPDELGNWALGGTPYLLQHEFRVRSSNGFHSLFLPRNKSWSAPTVTTNGDGATIFIALTNSGSYRLSNNIAEFSRTTTNIAAQVFSGTAQLVATNGIGISGGPAELTINRGANTNFTISLSGPTGVRTITNASLAYPLICAASGANVTRYASR